VLTEKRVLLLLDNAAGPAQVEPLRPPAGCTLLVTSRRRFSLGKVPPHDLDSLPPADAVTLLRELAPRLNESEAVMLAEACGRLPQALRLAGTTLQLRDDLTPARYLKRLEERGRLSELGEVAAAIAVSEEALPEPLRTRWHELSVFSGGFELAWAAAVWNVDETAAEDDLGALRTHSLLLWNAEAQLYRLHDLVREYARGKLSDAHHAVAALRHASCFRDVMITADGVYQKGGESVAAALRLFDRAWVETQAAFAWARKHSEDREAQRLCVDIPDRAAYLLYLRQHPRERLDWRTAAVEAARSLGDRRGEGYALNRLGLAYAALGQPQRAIELFEQRLAIAREVGDRRSEGYALNNLGSAYRNLGQPQRAIECHEQALTISREIGNREGEANACWNMGLALEKLDRLAEAIPLVELRVAFLREIGHPDADKDAAAVEELRQRLQGGSPSA
jgi:tetratricopeptide (TPR) repeat protein